MNSEKVVIKHEGNAMPYWAIEVVQIFNGVAPFDITGNCNSFTVNGKNPPDTNDNHELKRWLYVFLSELTGYSSPWGCMTGIRPTKIINTLFAEGHDEKYIRDYLEKFYLVSQEKTDLAMETVRIQKPFLRGVDTAVADWYSNIPFCPTRCLYCAFTSHAIGQYKNKLDDYLDALERELEATAKLHSKVAEKAECLYLGGGTPTSLPEKQFDRYINMFSKYIDISSLKEFALEAGRPDSITPAKLESAKKAGVTRLSVNPQTMNDITLNRIGRLHNAMQVRDAVKMAKEAGFENINMDLIAGLPGETPEMFRHTLEEVRKLEPTGITVHTLSIKRAADLKQDEENKAVLDAEITGRMVREARAFTAAMGMHPFYMYRQKHMVGNHENVSYSIPGYESPYNIHIMEEDRTILGIGAGAVTKAVAADGNISRAYNVKGIEYYLERGDEMMKKKRELFEPFSE